MREAARNSKKVGFPCFFFFFLTRLNWEWAVEGRLYTVPMGLTGRMGTRLGSFLVSAFLLHTLFWGSSLFCCSYARVYTLPLQPRSLCKPHAGGVNSVVRNRMPLAEKNRVHTYAMQVLQVSHKLPDQRLGAQHWHISNPLLSPHQQPAHQPPTPAPPLATVGTE